MERFSGTIFGLKRVGKYITDGDLRKAYAEYKESEETALRLIVNTVLAEGWIISLSSPKTIEELAREHGYTNIIVIAGIGVRTYFYNLGYQKDGVYVAKHL